GARANPNIKALFSDLGNSVEFPGNPWVPERTFIWILHEIDPSWNLKVQNGETIDPVLFANGFLPRYFLMTGKMGFHSTWDPDIAPHGTVGQPALVRMATTGLMTHSIHTHGNHMFMIGENAQPQVTIANKTVPEVIVRDTVNVPPLNTLDVIIPFQ
ncbi:MAG: multicopper oxidase domain-containing protein, partial [Syntrophobacteraceae bacterium]